MNNIREAIKQIEVGWKSQKIRLVGTSLNREEFTLLKDTLALHSTIKSLEICLCELNEAEIISFAKEMQNFSLVGLQFVHVELGDEGALALATAVQECALKKLDIAFNNVGPRGARALAEALKDCGLESLLLGRNNIGVDGAQHIAEILRNGGTTLKTLDLSKNLIKDAGMIAIANALPKCSLDTLLVDTNEITQEGVSALCQALKVSPHVLNLSIGGNKLKDQSIVEIAETLQYTNVERLSINANDFGDEGMKALALAINQSRTLEVLDLKQNLKINNSAVELLLKSMKTHQTMRTVVLDDTGSSQEVRDQMQKLLTGLHSDHAKLMVTLCSVQNVKRLGVRSSVRHLPLELMRRVANMLVAST